MAIDHQTMGKRHFLCVSSSLLGSSGLENLRKWVGERKWGFSKNAKVLKHIRPGDRLAFYVPGHLKRVVATATVTSSIESAPTLSALEGDKAISWHIRLTDIRWATQPIKLTKERRERMHALKGYKHWAWFLQSGTRVVSEHDFAILTEGIQ